MTHYYDRVYLAEPEYPREDAYQAWVESEAYAEWMAENAERLIAGKPIYETETFGISDKFYLLEHAKWCDQQSWATLTDDEKELVNAWNDFCDASGVAQIMRESGDPDYKNQSDLCRIKWGYVKEAMAPIAERKVALMSEDYFNKYVWKGK